MKEYGGIWRKYVGNMKVRKEPSNARGELSSEVWDLKNKLDGFQLQESIEDFLVKPKNKDHVSCLSSRVSRLLSEFF